MLLLFIDDTASIWCFLDRSRGLMNQRRLLMIAVAFVAAVVFNARAGFAQGVELLPNLVPRPAQEISIAQDQTNGHILLRFAAVNTNIGLGRLELRAGSVTSSGQ